MGSHMLKHVGYRLNGLLTNLVYADRVPAVFTSHISGTRNISAPHVHVLTLRFKSEQF